MKKNKYNKLGSYLLNKDLKGFSLALSFVHNEEAEDIQKYLRDFASVHNLSDASYWKLAVLVVRENFEFAKGLLFDINFKHQYRTVIDPKYREQFRVVFNIFCQYDKDIKDILKLLNKFNGMFDASFLDSIATRSYKFDSLDHYGLVLDVTHPTFNEALNFLTKDRSIKAFYLAALLTLNEDLRKEFHWKTLSINDIRSVSASIRNTRSNAARFTADLLMDYCSRDAVNDALDAVLNKKFKRFNSLFEIYGNRNDTSDDSDDVSKHNSSKQLPSRTIPDGCHENTEIATIEGIPLKIVAFKNCKTAFTESFDNYMGGILFPQNITYNNVPIPMNIACHIINVLYRSKQKTGFQITDSIELNGKSYAILTKDIKYYYRKYDVSQFQLLKEGMDCPIEIISSSPHFKGVKILTTELKGYISLTDLRNIKVDNDTNTFSAAISSIPKNEILPIIFGTKISNNIRTDRTIESENNRRYANLFTPLELRHLLSEEKNLVDIMLAEYPSFGMTKENAIIEDQNIICRFNDSSIDAEEYLESIQKLLVNNNFWVSPRTAIGGSHTLFLFNQDSLLLEIEEVDNVFYLKRRLRYATQDQDAYKIIEKNKLTKLKISGSKIQIVGTYDTYPSDYSALTTFNYIDRLNSYYRIKYDLAKRVIDTLNDTAAVFVNQQRYLNYQIDKEKERTKLQLSFSPNRLKPISGNWQDESVSILINMSNEEYQVLLGSLPTDGGIDNEVRVNTIDEDGRIIDHCILAIDVEGEYVLHFLGQHKNISDYLSTGIKLQGDANVKHLRVQSNALNDFTHDEDSLFRDLLGDNIAIPDSQKYSKIKFLNGSFANVEPGNNQPLAVRKALALDYKGILLIQGPPGTGKTTTIVEIIRQLVEEKRKVLVCSQSHAAVQNIFEKLEPYCQNILRIDEKDEHLSESKNFNTDDYERFLRNNRILLDRLKNNGGSKEYTWDDSIFAGIQYRNEVIQKQYRKLHLLLAKYYEDNQCMNTIQLHQMIEYLESEAKNMSGSMIETQIYQSKDVILGTCVGVGMNYILRNNTVRFDTVIIDEAAKANLAETLVPMKMGDRYILVGDDNQLPPYVDQENIKDMMKSEKYNPERNNDISKMVSAQNKSLFEYLHYHRHPVFPEECLITLNYQYRMNPEIGAFISNLFYNDKINNGEGTDKQDIYIPKFPNPVTVIDTTGQKGNIERTINCSHRNEYEAHYICDEILPCIKSVLLNNEELSLGIITPYSSQCDFIQSLIGDKKLRDCVHTIDSIQGMEFDIVIFSFVRSFPPKSNQKVGFVDDMKRLNVSLSRAKKKLIIIGNMSTLANPKAHYEIMTEGIKPIDVFKKLSEMPTKISVNKTEIEHFLSSGITEGTKLNDCSWNYFSNTIIGISFNYKEKDYHFRMKVTNDFLLDKHQNDKLNIKYLGVGKDSRPEFGFSSLAEELKYTLNAIQVRAKCISLESFPVVKMEVEGQIIELELRKSKANNHLLPGSVYYFSRRNGSYLSIDENACFDYFTQNNSIGDRVDGIVTGKLNLQYSLYQYFVEVDGFTCACYSKDYLEIDTNHIFLYSECKVDKKQITLKYFRKYDS